MHRFFAVFLALIAGPVKAADELENRDLVAGQELYAEHCAACHGANLEGQPNWQVRNADGTMPAPPHDETGHTWHHDNQLLFSYTQLGGADALAERGVSGFESAMPAFGDLLTDEEIWNVLAYIRSTWSEEVRAFQSGRNPPHD